LAGYYRVTATRSCNPFDL